MEDDQHKSEVIGLLKLIQASSNIKINKGEFTHQWIEEKLALVNVKQRHLSQDDHHRVCRDKVDLYEQLIGPIANKSSWIDQYMKTVTKIPTGITGSNPHDLATAKANCCKNYIATLFLLNSDLAQYGQMVARMKNSRQMDSFK